MCSLKSTKKALSAITIVTLFLTASCEFTPDDPPLTQIDQPGEPPPVEISLNNGYDTIVIDWKTTLIYSVQGKNQILSVDIDFQGKKLHHYVRGSGASLSFDLDPSTYPNGVYPLTITIITSSGTGSLAEKVGAEGYLYQLDWPVVIDKTPTKKLNFISIDSLKEGVSITWEKFDHPGFRYYRLRKSSSSFSGTVDLVTYNDPDRTSFIDTSYMEGVTVNYMIELGGRTSGLNTTATNSREYFELPHKPRISNIRDFKVDVSWDPPRKLHLLDYYYMHRSKTTVTIQDNARIFEPDPRTRTYSVTFGTKNYFGLLYVPKPVGGYVYSYGLKRAEIEFQPGQEMPAYRYACAIRNTGNILLSRNGRIYKYNPREGLLTDSVVTNSEYPDYFTLSDDGTFFGYTQNGKFITRSTADFRILNTMTNPDFADNIGILLRLSISNTGRLMMILDNNVVFIFDITTGTTLIRKVFTSLSWMVGAISPDGNNIITQEYSSSLVMRYYRITGDQIVSMAEITTSGLGFFPVIPAPFGPDNDIYVIHNSKIEVRNISDFSVKRIIQVPIIKYIDYDKMRAIGFSSGSDLAYLYDLQTGTVIKNLLVSNMIQVIYHNDYLMTSGRKLLLQ